METNFGDLMNTKKNTKSEFKFIYDNEVRAEDVQLEIAFQLKRIADKL